jgi:hypothetical protein
MRSLLSSSAPGLEAAVATGQDDFAKAGELARQMNAGVAIAI